MQNFEMCVPDLCTVSGRYGPEGNAPIVDDALKFRISRQRTVQPRTPDLKNGKIIQDREKAVHMVGMGMGEDREVDGPDAPIPQVRRQHAAADVEPVVPGPAAVYKDILARSRFHDRAISLSHVDERYPGPLIAKEEECNDRNDKDA
mgnify:CR=1 FL=1